MKENDRAEEQQRREAVRVSTRLMLSVRPITRERFACLATDFENGVPLSNQEGIAEFKQQFNARDALERLRDREPELAAFLASLDDKLNLILKAIHNGKEDSGQFVLTDTDVSAGGINFSIDKPYEKGTFLEVHMALPPDNVYVYAAGEVVRCEAIVGAGMKGGYRVAVRFALMTETDQDALVRYIFWQQRLALLHRRLDRDRETSADNN